MTINRVFNKIKNKYFAKRTKVLDRQSRLWKEVNELIAINIKRNEEKRRQKKLRPMKLANGRIILFPFSDDEYQLYKSIEEGKEILMDFVEQLNPVQPQGDSDCSQSQSQL